MARESEWTVTDSDDNAESVASKAAQANARHRITGVTASFGAAAIKLLQIKKGTDVVWERFVHNVCDIEFDSPILGDTNELVSATLAASGTGGVLGKVGIKGYTDS